MSGTAARVIERLGALAAISEETGRLTRRFATPALREATTLVRGWMGEAGMSVRHDAVGNVVGRYAGAGADARVLVLGSHLDTVPGAGRFDGALGVVAGIAAVERLAARGAHLPFAVEVVGFADEEGTRFGTAYLGSAAYCGSFDPTWLDLRDADGISMSTAIRGAGGDPDGIAAAACDTASLAGYCEVHMEQGPVLEAEDLPVGVVSAVAGQTRARLTFTGEAGHAGTVPMTLRRDALAAAAEAVLAVEAVGGAGEGLVATVGELAVEPGAGNVVPGRVIASLDVRHADDAERLAALTEIEHRVRALADARGVALGWEALQQASAVTTSPELTATLAGAIGELGHPVRSLVSGAGHDAVLLATVTPVAMLFVRCAGGVSHSPEESVSEADIAVALDVLDCFVARLAAAT